MSNGTASITVPSTTTNITENDTVVSFAIASTPSISEDLAETATFTVDLTGTLAAGETASVVVNLGAGSATDAVDYDAFEQAIIDAAALESGVSYDAGTNTLTFDSTSDGSFSFDVTAIDDADIEGTETIIADLSNATVTNGTASITVPSTTTDITENDVPDFPAGLAYSIAGGGGTGAFLYGIDLATGATFQIGAVVVNGNDKAQFSSLTLNPVDGYLYGLADQGSLNGFVRVNAATGEAELLVSNSLFNTSTSGMAFDSAGNLFIAINKTIYQIDTADLEPSHTLVIGDLQPVSSFTNGGVAIDSMAYDESTDSFYFVSGSQLYSIDNGDTGVIATAIGSGIGDTIDGLSFDESGTLWGADNLGTIYRIDTSSGTGTIVATISNSDVTNSGIHSLAISQVDPGTYVTLAEGANIHTQYYSFDALNQNNVLASADIGLAADSDVTIDITGRTINVTQSVSGDPVDVVAIRVDASADITVDGFDQTDVFTRDGSPSTVTITDAEGGTIQTGEADDVVTITAADAGLVTSVDETFTVTTDGGDDLITLNNLLDTSYIINTGEALDSSGNLIQNGTDVDTVAINIDTNFDLGDGSLSLSNVEILDISGSGNDTLTLSAADVLDASDGTNTLIILGDVGDSLASNDTWSLAAEPVLGVDGTSYNAYTFDTGTGIATLLVDPNVNINTIVD